MAENVFETFAIEKLSVLDIKAVQYIKQGEKCPCLYGQTLHLLGRKIPC